MRGAEDSIRTRVMKVIRELLRLDVNANGLRIGRREMHGGPRLRSHKRERKNLDADDDDGAYNQRHRAARKLARRLGAITTRSGESEECEQKLARDEEDSSAGEGFRELAIHFAPGERNIGR